MANHVATCPVCLKPLADLPAVLRQGDDCVHATSWSGEEPAEKATAESNETAARKGGAGRLDGARGFSP